MADEDSSTINSLSAMQSLRAILTLSGDETLAVAKTAVRDGAKGFVERGISVIQRLNERRFGQALLDEIEEMRSAGKIREDFTTTDAGTSTFQEFLEMIGDKPDEQRFRVFCALFMSANAPDASFSEAVFDLELMGLLRKLSIGEMHLLYAAMQVKSYTVTSASDLLLAPLRKVLGYTSATLIHRNAQPLLECGLLSRNTWDNPGGSGGATRELLTDLGFALLERIENYNEFKRESGSLK